MGKFDLFVTVGEYDFDIVEYYSGVPQSVPIYNSSSSTDVFDLLELPKNR